MWMCVGGCVGGAEVSREINKLVIMWAAGVGTSQSPINVTTLCPKLISRNN